MAANGYGKFSGAAGGCERGVFCVVLFGMAVWTAGGLVCICPAPCAAAQAEKENKALIERTRKA